jgi:hypothetical protein
LACRARAITAAMSWLTDFAAAPWLPHLSAEVQAVVRISYSLLLAGTVILAIPHRRRFFLSERWGGYGRSGLQVDLIQNPVIAPLVLAAWLVSALLLGAGIWSPWTALVAVFISRYYFIQMRWHGVLRGMGAPGFVIYWLGAAVFLLELTRSNAPALQPLALLGLQIDLAAIMLIAGLYKLAAGYARNEGMELGLSNPEWGHWWRWYSRLRPNNVGFRALNHLAWSTEIAIGLLAIHPRTRGAAGLLLFISFGFIGSQIRLALLCPTMMAAALLYVADSSAIAGALSAWVPADWIAATTGPPMLAGSGSLLALALIAYILLLPLAYGGLLYNFFGRRSLPPTAQRVLEIYTNTFGLILWRVFSADVTNFYVLIHEEASGPVPTRRLISAYPGTVAAGIVRVPWRNRFAHVAESIAITTIFTTLRYYPRDRLLFEDRLLRYARTVPCRLGARLVFEYRAITKERGTFRHVSVSEFTVDLVIGTIVERPVAGASTMRQPGEFSPVFEGLRPGTYLPRTV